MSNTVASMLWRERDQFIRCLLTFKSRTLIIYACLEWEVLLWWSSCLQEILFAASRFSNDLPNSILQPLAVLQYSCILPLQENYGQPLSDTPTTAPQSESVILSFLTQRSEIYDKHMPHRKKIHPPYFWKTHFYKLFLKYYQLLYSDGPSTISYISWVWEKFYLFIKVRRSSRFPRCAFCEELNAAIR